MPATNIQESPLPLASSRDLLDGLAHLRGMPIVGSVYRGFRLDYELRG